MSDEQPEKEAGVKAGELPKISKQHALFVDNYFAFDVYYNQTEAYQRTYPRCTRETARREGHRLLTNPHIQAHVQARFAEMRQSTDEILAQFAEEGRAKMGTFLKPVDEWALYPRPTDEILEEEERIDDTDPEKPKTRIFYRVRRLVLDIDKVLDPKYSHLIHKFIDKGKEGMSIELYDAQAARREALKVQGAYKNNVTVAGPGGEALAMIVKTLDYKIFDTDELARILAGESEILVYADALKRISASQSQSSD